MERIIYLNKENVQGMKFIGYEEANIKGEYGCALCGKGLKNLYIISNGKEKAIVGSECVLTIAEMQDKNTLEGITKLPKNKRNQVKRNKISIEDEELPF